MADKSREAILKEMLQDLGLIEKRIAILEQQVKLLISREVGEDEKTKKRL